jgi:L-histidine Nalpha-methyltransferase
VSGPMSPTTTARVDVHLEPDHLQRALRADAERGLTSMPKELPPKWFYDEVGSLLFDEITRLPEYYPTRREREILETHASTIASVTQADTLVELGSGTSEKTRLLLSALHKEGCLRRFIPFDVSEEVLRASADSINTEYPGLEVHAVVGDFEHHLHTIPDSGRRIIAFLGSTIGNFPPVARADFLRSLRSSTHEQDFVLLGFDLVKDLSRLEKAYNDSAGVTADFNRNVLHVLNRELGADFDVKSFDHIARWNAQNEWIEMVLRSTTEQRVQLRSLGLNVAFSSGEEMRTEISAKFHPDRIAAELRDAGFVPQRWWTDAAGDFGVALCSGGGSGNLEA